jgi:hypothetical protein
MHAFMGVKMGLSPDFITEYKPFSHGLVPILRHVHRVGGILPVAPDDAREATRPPKSEMPSHAFPVSALIMKLLQSSFLFFYEHLRVDGR